MAVFLEFTTILIFWPLSQRGGIHSDIVWHVCCGGRRPLLENRSYFQSLSSIGRIHRLCIWAVQAYSGAIWPPFSHLAHTGLYLAAFFGHVQPLDGFFNFFLFSFLSKKLKTGMWVTPAGRDAPANGVDEAVGPMSSTSSRITSSEASASPEEMHASVAVLSLSGSYCSISSQPFSRLSIVALNKKTPKIEPWGQPPYTSFGSEWICPTFTTILR